MTWLDDVRFALETLGGQGHLSEVYERIKDIRPQLGPHWKATVRATLETHSSDSKAWNGKYNFFKLLNRGQGVWSLKYLPQEILVTGEKYSRQDLLKVFNEENLGREGVFYCNGFETNLLFSDLNKKGQYSYNNFFESDYFHWDSQPNQSIDTPRIAEIVRKEREILLFCRLEKKSAKNNQAFVYCGEVEFFDYEVGSQRPVHIIFDVLEYEDECENENLLELWRWSPTKVKTSLRMSEPSQKRKTKFKRPNKTERVGLIVSRVGQGYYREEVLKRWGRKCAVTGCSIEKILIASHIVPWSLSSDRERLDVGNGILLSPDLDALFDRHLISFTDKGKILVSKKISKKIKALGVHRKMSLFIVHEDMKPYLERHRLKFQENDES